MVNPDDVEYGRKVYETTPSTVWDNLTHNGWVLDDDAFKVNQLRHPYQGSIYHGIARSTYLGYWQASALTFAGSLLWEIAGETTPPSYNDQVASGIAGSFLGEPLFRMASLLLETDTSPGIWREITAAILCPPLGFNRLFSGERFSAVFPSRNPAVFWRVRGGGTMYLSLRDDSGSGRNNRTEATGDFLMLYGLPGKAGYRYDRPFDFFRFELTAVSRTNDPIENIVTRGTLLAREYNLGDAYRGVWGLYGSYDYLSPHVFRVSTTGLSLGSTAHWWMSRTASLQGSALAGAGYGAGSDIAKETREGFHYGVTGQGLLSLRLAFSDMMMIEGNGRIFYLSGLGSNRPNSTETMMRLGLGVTLRLQGPHALSLQYVTSSRHVSERGGRADRQQRASALTVLYSWLSDRMFGALDWREAAVR